MRANKSGHSRCLSVRLLFVHGARWLIAMPMSPIGDHGRFTSIGPSKTEQVIAPWSVARVGETRLLSEPATTGNWRQALLIVNSCHFVGCISRHRSLIAILARLGRALAILLASNVLGHPARLWLTGWLAPISKRRLANF